jgi:hypothetical protein
MSHDDSITKRMKGSEEVLEPVPLQLNYPDPNWKTPCMKEFEEVLV